MKWKRSAEELHRKLRKKSEKGKEKGRTHKTQLELKAVTTEKKNVASVMDNPVEWYRKIWPLRLLHPEVQCRKWSWGAKLTGPQPLSPVSEA